MPTVGQSFCRQTDPLHGHLLTEQNKQARTRSMLPDKAVSGPITQHSLLASPRRDTDHCLARSYYNLATDLYEYGWGQSFHFCRYSIGEPSTRPLRATSTTWP